MPGVVRSEIGPDPKRILERGDELQRAWLDEADHHEREGIGPEDTHECRPARALRPSGRKQETDREVQDRYQLQQHRCPARDLRQPIAFDSADGGKREGGRDGELSRGRQPTPTGIMSQPITFSGRRATRSDPIAVQVRP